MRESTAIITISDQGLRIMERLKEEFPNADCFVSPGLTSDSSYKIIEKGTIALTAEIFQQYGNLIYIMPLGVVTRAIAPHIKSKYTDPAVVTIDLVGRFTVATLSGHEGGANQVAEKAGKALNGEFVIGTSTEAEKRVVLGIGCRKGVSSEDVKAAVDKALEESGEKIENVRLAATVEIKKAEQGLLEFCRQNEIPLRFIAIKEIENARLNVRESEFVKQTIGVGAVAEPCALLAAQKPELIQERIQHQNVTVAVARENLEW